MTIKVDDLTRDGLTAEDLVRFKREELDPHPVLRTDRPVIDTANLGLDEMAAAAWAAIEAANTPPRIFLYAGGVLAWLTPDEDRGLRVEVMTLEHVRHHLADVATFSRWTPGARGRAPEKKPAFPPAVLAADLLAVPRATLPRLQRVVRMPVFTRDGRLLMAPGYDASSGLYLAPPAGLVIPSITSQPSAQDIADARELLCTELLGDFPCVTKADIAHAVALLLTPLLRELVMAGGVPVFVISKPTPRTGAGLLTKVVSIVQTGAPAPATTLPREEDEVRKRLTALLIPGPAMTLLDNLHGRLDSAALATIVTTPVWEDRLLGRTQMLRLPVRTVYVVTGNNVALSNEIAGRAVLIRLDPKVEDPSTRTGFRHPDLEAWARAHRGRLLGAALTLGQAWLTAGRPRGTDVFGGFEDWAAVLGGVLSVAGIPDFLDNRRELFEKADEESAHVRAFLSDWWRAHQEQPVLVNMLIQLARAHPLPIASRSEQGTLIRLGQLVQSIEDRRFDLGAGLGVAVKRAGERRRAVLWQLTVCESGESGESPSAAATSLTRAPACALADRHSPDSQTHMVEAPAPDKPWGEV